MLGEMALSGLMVFSPIGSTTELNQIEYKPTSQLHSFSDLDYELLSRDREYINENGNNFKFVMNSDSTITTKVPKLNNKILAYLKILIKNRAIDFDEKIFDSSDNSWFEFIKSSSVINFNSIGNSSSYFSQEHKLDMKMDKSYDIVNCKIEEIKSLMSEAPAVFGEDIDYISDYEKIRKENFYQELFGALSSASERIQLSLIVLLSQIANDEIYEFEKKFIVSCLNKNSLQFKEWALTTISVWNNNEFLPYLKDLDLGNRFLQKRLDKIILRFSQSL